MSKKRQALDFVLIRSGRISGNEAALMAYIYSFSEYCAPRKLAHIGESLGWCDRKVRMVLDLLVAKGLVHKRYTTFKRVILTLASLDKQAAFRTAKNAVMTVVRNIAKLRGKRYDRQRDAELIRQTTAEPIKNKTPEEENILGKLNFKKNALGGEGKRDVFSEIQRFYEHLARKEAQAQ